MDLGFDLTEALELLAGLDIKGTFGEKIGPKLCCRTLVGMIFVVLVVVNGFFACVAARRGSRGGVLGCLTKRLV